MNVRQCAGFETTDDFPECLAKDLNRWLNDQEKPWNRSRKEPIEISEPQPDNQLLEGWLRIQAADCAQLPLEVLDARQGLEQDAAPIRLPDIFVPLKAVAPPEKWLEEYEQDPSTICALAEGERGEPEAVLDLLAREPHAVLIGDPGAGKSALVNQLAWQLTMAADRVQLYCDSVDLLVYHWHANRCFRNSDGNPLRLDELDPVQLQIAAQVIPNPPTLLF
ncbi:MAG: hypothetical protein ABW168_06000 [Sedimenticola sp.]